MAATPHDFPPSSTIGQALDIARAALAEKGVPNPELESRLILEEVLGSPPLGLLPRRAEKLSPETLASAGEFLTRRLRGEPLQYIFGRAYFRDLVLKVRPAVLIPRPETELLVDIVLSHVKSGVVCDVGVGSGAICLSLATENRALRVIGVERSREALACALENKKLAGADNVDFVLGDLLGCVRPRSLDAVAANLPYVSGSEHDGLDDEVRLHEPVGALVGGGDDGMLLLERIVPQAAECLKPGGLLVLEHGAAQGEKTLRLLVENGSFREARTSRDLTGRDRFAIAIRS